MVRRDIEEASGIDDVDPLVRLARASAPAVRVVSSVLVGFGTREARVAVVDIDPKLDTAARAGKRRRTGTYGSFWVSVRVVIRVARVSCAGADAGA